MYQKLGQWTQPKLFQKITLPQEAIIIKKNNIKYHPID